VCAARENYIHTLRSDRGSGHNDEVHLRIANETSDKLIVGVMVDVHWCADLLDAAVAQHNNLVGQRHRLNLIVGHVNHGSGKALVKPSKLDAGLASQGRIEVRQWFIE
jgi:hypothetical protein